MIITGVQAFYCNGDCTKIVLAKGGDELFICPIRHRRTGDFGEVGLDSKIFMFSSNKPLDFFSIVFISSLLFKKAIVPTRIVFQVGVSKYIAYGLNDFTI